MLLRNPTAVLSLPALIVLVALAACGDEPQRIAPAAQAQRSGTAASPHTTQPAVFAGRVYLSGSLAQASEGFVFLIARQPGSRVPALTRRVAVGDAQWTVQGAERMLPFTLDERDSMGGVNMPLAPTMEFEARFDPDGKIDTPDGVVKQIVSTKPGVVDLILKLQPTQPTEPAASGSSLKGG